MSKGVKALLNNHQTGLPTTFDILHFQVQVNPAIFVDVEWHDTGGIEDYDRLRPLQYLGAHLFLICFAIDAPDSLDNVQEKVQDSFWISREIARLTVGNNAHGGVT